MPVGFACVLAVVSSHVDWFVIAVEIDDTVALSNSRRVEGQRISRRFLGREYATVSLLIFIVHSVSSLNIFPKPISPSLPSVKHWS